MINQDNRDLLNKLDERLHRLDQYEQAFNEWLRLTEWVQETKDWPFPVLGLHRAEVMNKYIKHLEEQNAELRRQVKFWTENC